MAYNANVPQSTDLLSQSQSDILNNFIAIQTLIDVNHVDFASGDAGKHKFITFPVQNPAPTFAAGEEGLYSFLNATTVQNELYVHKQTGATTAEIPFTASILSTNSAPIVNSGGWTYLPSGLLLLFGHSTANGNTAFTFAALNPSAPVFTNVLSIILCTAYNNASDGNGFVRLSGYTAAGFNAYGSARTTVSPASVSFQYLAIGY
jgi:hypothetical protein